MKERASAQVMKSGGEHARRSRSPLTSTRVSCCTGWHSPREPGVPSGPTTQSHADNEDPASLQVRGIRALDVAEDPLDVGAAAVGIDPGIRSPGQRLADLRRDGTGTRRCIGHSAVVSGHLMLRVPPHGQHLAFGAVDQADDAPRVSSAPAPAQRQHFDICVSCLVQRFPAIHDLELLLRLLAQFLNRHCVVGRLPVDALNVENLTQGHLVVPCQIPGEFLIQGIVHVWPWKRPPPVDKAIVKRPTSLIWLQARQRRSAS